ncbi:unnamed protein product, partial [Porites lobata]
IRLDIASIAKNPGRKATAKLMLNSFWGKFGERINKPTTVTVQHPADLFNLKRIQVVPRVKQYGLVFDKRVINVTTRSSYPYGYERIGDELDLLLDL